MVRTLCQECSECSWWKETGKCGFNTHRADPSPLCAVHVGHQAHKHSRGHWAGVHLLMQVCWMECFRNTWQAVWCWGEGTGVVTVHHTAAIPPLCSTCWGLCGSCAGVVNSLSYHQRTERICPNLPLPPCPATLLKNLHMAFGSSQGSQAGKTKGKNLQANPTEHY